MLLSAHRDAGGVGCVEEYSHRVGARGSVVRQRLVLQVVGACASRRRRSERRCAPSHNFCGARAATGGRGYSRPQGSLFPHLPRGLTWRRPKRGGARPYRSCSSLKGTAGGASRFQQSGACRDSLEVRMLQARAQSLRQQHRRRASGDKLGEGRVAEDEGDPCLPDGAAQTEQRSNMHRSQA